MKLLISTVSRSDFGILSTLINTLKKNKKFNVKTFVTGEHYSKKMGNTFQEILNKKIKINTKIKLGEYASEPISVLKKSSEIILKFSNYLTKNKPDLLIVLGDKYETFIISYCAFIYRIPIAHIHGGEKTVGSMDDSFRHSITKFSNLHFVSTDEYKKRVIQLGEKKNYIYVVGALGSEMLSDLNYLSKKNVENKLKMKFNKFNFLITIN